MSNPNGSNRLSDDELIMRAPEICSDFMASFDPAASQAEAESKCEHSLSVKPRADPAQANQ
jgi:hypothetical protein